ncbi:MAG: transcriptional regulator [Clostridium butyricum]|nr:transcriptional regulator [Clostridium butyricum]
MENKNVSYCQSCGMPLNSEVLGTNIDNSKNEDYCIYCFKNGKFTADISMNDMIEFCIPHMVDGNKGMTEEKARNMMKQFFPTLKRWNK